MSKIISDEELKFLLEKSGERPDLPSEKFRFEALRGLEEALSRFSKGFSGRLSSLIGKRIEFAFRKLSFKRFCSIEGSFLGLVGRIEGFSFGRGRGIAYVVFKDDLQKALDIPDVSPASFLESFLKVFAFSFGEFFSRFISTSLGKISLVSEESVASDFDEHFPLVSVEFSVRAKGLADVEFLVPVVIISRLRAFFKEPEFFSFLELPERSIGDLIPHEESYVDVSFSLGSSCIPLRKVLNLKPGDLLELENSEKGRAFLEIKGRPVFLMEDISGKFRVFRISKVL